MQKHWASSLHYDFRLAFGGTMKSWAVPALVIGGWPTAKASPSLAALFAAVMGGFAGLMAGGLVALRPDHGAAIRSMRGKLQFGQWGVVARPRDASSADQAFAALADAGGARPRSL